MKTKTQFKTLVKYRPEAMFLSVRSGKLRLIRSAEQLTKVGAGDCTVQPDGVTVWVARGHMDRLK